MTHVPLRRSRTPSPIQSAGISSKPALNAHSLHPTAPTIGTHTSLQDLRRTVGASEIPIAPADRGAHLTRFPSLAAFERGPPAMVRVANLGEWDRHPQRVTEAAKGMHLEGAPHNVASTRERIGGF